MISVAHDQIHDETIPTWGTWHLPWTPDDDAPEAGFEPSEADELWWECYLGTREFKGMRDVDGPTDADLEEARRLSEWQDAIERGCMITDEDIAVVQNGAVG